jgi:type VI secretion system protein ImpJ
MTPKPLHWHEGLFFRPHHLQAADRYTARLVDQNARFAQWYAWGYRRCEIDAQALAGFRFVVRELEARFRDGTVVRLPDDAPLPDLDLKPAFQGRSSLDLYLAIPVPRSGQPNVAAPSVTTPTRFRTARLKMPDENTGVNEQELVFRTPEVKVLTGDDDRSGYELLPLARLKRADRPEATPELDHTFIPPVLACDCWPVLQQRILQDVYARLNKKIEVVAGQVTSRGITFDSHSQGDARRMHQLDRMNEGYAVLGHTAFVPGVHPIDAFVELTRLVGQLAVFGKAARPPALPRYDHDDLGPAFWKLKQLLDELLNQVEDPAYDERPFVGSGKQMRVQLEPQWLESGWQMYVGVRSNVTQDECVRALTRPERLGMKIGSSDRVEDIFTLGKEGMRFTHKPNPPRDLPAAPNLTYFEVSRESGTAEWAQVQRMKTLAVRFKLENEGASLDNQREVTIRTGAQSSTFAFTLYLIPAAR